MSKYNLTEFQRIVGELLSSFNCEKCDFVKYAVIPATLFISASFGLKTWLKAEMALSFLFGLALMVYPKPLIAFQMKGDIDDYHVFLAGLLGCYLIYSALFPAYLFKSRDESVFVSHFWSKIISSNLIFITIGFSYMDALRFDYKLLCFSGGAVLSTLLINTYFLSRSSTVRAQDHMYKPANIVAKIEFFMLLSAGLILFAFPEKANLDITKINDGHRSICRMCGAILFSLSLESFTMPSFLYESDKKKFLMARLAGSVIELVVILMGYFYLKTIKTNKSLSIYLFVNTTYNLLVLAGYISCRRKVNDLKRQAESANASHNSSLNESKLKNN